MAAESDAVSRLMEQLAKDRQAFIESTNKTHQLLQETLLALKVLSSSRNATSENIQSPTPVPEFAHSPAPFPPSFNRRQSIRTGALLSLASQRMTTADIEVESYTKDEASSTFTSSDSDSDDNESTFVDVPLRSEQYDMEGFRQHLLDYPWTEDGKAILCGFESDTDAVYRPCIFPFTSAEAQADRSHLSHYSIYDVGADGVPLDIKLSKDQNPTRALQIWNRIRNTNTEPTKRKAVGRIVIVREPSPCLFAALHYTMNDHFDMDEIFHWLKHEDPALIYPHRAFDKDERHRRTFVITLEYFTIIGENCKPMAWQTSDEQETERTENHIAISRCSSVIALALEGPPVSRVKNRDRRIPDRYGDVYDPFSPWRVLSIQAYPDWHATTDTHKPTNHYFNGPEAFLHTVKAEFIDAQKRLKEVYNHVSDLIEPPANFIFNSKVREALLFEDDKFTYSKKYFWAKQTLSIINQDITEMIDSYRETFRDCVWDGSNKIIWPGESSLSFRYQHWRKHMAKLRRDMDQEVEKLEYIRVLNMKKMEDIDSLRENLFSGTSVMESRRSVEQTLVTIEQNRSVLLLTLVTIFFLPLTFVTSVFGMTNMDPTESYSHFGWAMLGICIPTYIFIGSLHTDAGLLFWQHVKNAVMAKLSEWLARLLLALGYHPHWTQRYDPTHKEQQPTHVPKSRIKRSNSATRTAMISRIHSVAEDGIPISRLSTRERVTIPRPQATSGDAVNTARHIRTRSNEVTFSIDRAALAPPVDKLQDTSTSVSPRTGSPDRDRIMQWDEQRRVVPVSMREQGSGRGMFSRFRWGREKDKGEEKDAGVVTGV